MFLAWRHVEPWFPVLGDFVAIEGVRLASEEPLANGISDVPPRPAATVVFSTAPTAGPAPPVGTWEASALSVETPLVL